MTVWFHEKHHLIVQDLGTIGPSYDSQKQSAVTPTAGGLNGQ